MIDAAEVQVECPAEDPFAELSRRYPPRPGHDRSATLLDWHHLHQLAAGAPAVASTDTPSAELGPAYRRN